jgi:hypothetical protein
MPPQGLRKELDAARSEEEVFVPYTNTGPWSFSALRFNELTGASSENGIPGGDVVMLIPVWAHSFGDVGWLSFCGC